MGIWTYDALGRVEQVHGHRDDGSSDPNLREISSDAIYGYDGLGRLVSVNWLTSTTPGESYTYNAIGNMSSKNGAAVSYHATMPHRATGIAGQYGYVPGPNGNQSSRWNLQSGATLTYQFDALDRLVGLDKDGQIKTFGYDASGSRIWMDRPGDGGNGGLVRYFSRYAESRDGHLVKFYWAGERMIASVTVPGAQFSEGKRSTNPVIPWWDLGVAPAVARDRGCAGAALRSRRAWWRAGAR